MSARGSKLMEALAREPLSANIANRRSLANKELPKTPAELPKLVSSPQEYDLSPTRSSRDYDRDADIVVADRLLMTDDAQDLRSRMDAELIALRRAQSIFADTHPSVDIQGKLQDLQEMYIGDILVRDCQITQLKSENAKLRSVSSNVSTPVESSSGRVNSLQRALAAERAKRTELELRVDDLTKKRDEAVDAQKHMSKMHSAHRLEVSQLKTRLSALQETHKKLSDRFLESKPEKLPPTPSSPREVVGEKISYVKFASLRAEKKEMEARLNAEIDRLKLAVDVVKSDRESEMEKQTVHQKRLFQELERKLKSVEQTKMVELKELKDLKQNLNQTLCQKDDLENRILELEIERNNLMARQSNSKNEEALRERIDERDDRIRQLQDQVNEMVASSKELDELLVRAEEDVLSSRDRVRELLAENDSLSLKIEGMASKVESTRQDEKIESQSLFLKTSTMTKLEHELDSIRASIALNGSTDSSDCKPQLSTAMATPALVPRTPSPRSIAPVTVADIDAQFREAIHMCDLKEYDDAVQLLEEASTWLAQLSPSELCDVDALKILESDIYGQLGIAFQSLNQIPEAIDAYRTAVHVDPEAHACHANLAVLLNHVGRHAEAEKHACFAADQEPDSPEYATLLNEILILNKKGLW